MYRDLTGERRIERRVLKGGVSRGDVIGHAVAEEWVALGTQERTETQPFQYAWRTGPGDAKVFYIEDEDFGMAYLEVESADPDTLARVLGGVDRDTARTPVFSDAEALAWSEAARSRGDKIAAVYLAALNSPRQYDAAWMPPYERAASDPDPDVRRAAVFAMSQTDWPEFRPVLAQLAEHDSDSQARSTAARLLAIFDSKYGAQTPAATA